MRGGKLEEEKENGRPKPQDLEGRSKPQNLKSLTARAKDRKAHV